MEIQTQISVEEKQQIATMLNRRPMTQAEALVMMEGRATIKIQDYIEDGPGFCGDLYLIVWGWPERISYISHYKATDAKGTRYSEWQIIFDGEIGDSTES